MSDTQSDSFTFRQVLQDELVLLLGTRSGQPKDGEHDAYDAAHAANLSGLAFSGGGIRSATFNLGIIQGLARVRRSEQNAGLLSRFDYLSTVSGGGYIGCWLSAWLHRASKRKRANAGFLDRFQKRISTRPCGFGPMHGRDAKECAELSGYENAWPVTTAGFPPLEHAAVRYLRRYSNYLAPRLGLSGDVLALVSLFLRNLILLQLALVAMVAAAILVPYVVFAMSSLLAGAAHFDMALLGVPIGEFTLGLGIVILLLVLVLCARQLKTPIVRDHADIDDSAAERKLRKNIKRRNAFIVAACAFASWMIVAGAVVIGGVSPLVNYLALGALTYAIAWGFGYALYAYFPRVEKSGGEPASVRRFVAAALVVLVSGAVFGFLAWLCGLVLDQPWAGSPGNRLTMIVFGPPAVMLVISFVVAVHIGAARELFTDLQREWWARLGGFVLYAIVAWIAVFAIAFYAPPLGQWLGKGGLAVVLAWAGASGAGAMIARSSGTGVGDATPSRTRKVLMRIAPWLFVVGLALIVAYAVNRALVAVEGIEVFWPDGLRIATAARLSAEEFGKVFAVGGALTFESALSVLAPALIALAAALANFLLISWRLDINIFSAHRLYRNRLTRAYLGASRAGKRNSHPFSGFDEEDDVPLASLAEQRPIPILNTTINMTGGDDLAWQTRRAASFAFTPQYVGYETKSSQGKNIGAYRRTAEFAAGGAAGATGNIAAGAGSQSDRGPGDALRSTTEPTGSSESEGGGAETDVEPGGLSLGTVMAISGAAASPNMGYNTSPAIAALLTAFNLRLGFWSGNPCVRPEWRSGNWEAWRKARPTLAIRPILAELTGSASAEAAWVNLSDGGHFDNLGVYELVRRRCRFIVVTDAGADPNHEFQDLANTVRKCWTDLGAHIFFHDLDKVSRKNGERFCESHGSLGLIEYPDRERGDPERYGLVLYLKCSLTRDVYDKFVDTRQYSVANADFPHQTTIDQFFDEEQFEAYRHLGFSVAEAYRSEISRFFDPATWQLNPEVLFDEAQRIDRIQRSSPSPESGPVGTVFSYTESVRIF